MLYNEETDIGNDAAGLLGACAVVRYSYKYWYDVSFDVNHQWYPVFAKNFGNGNGNNPSVQRPGWLKRTWNDIKAFFSDLGCSSSSGGELEIDLNCQWSQAGNVSSGS